MLVRFVFFIVVFLYVISLHSQTSKEEIKHQLKAEKNDSLKMELYKKLGVEWEGYGLDSAIFFYNKGVSIAKAKNYKSRLAVLEINKAFAYSSYGKKELSLRSLGKGLKAYKEAKDSSGILLATYNLGTFSLSFGGLSESVVYFKESIQLSKKLNQSDYLEKSLNNISIAYQYMGDYQSSITYLMEVLKLREAQSSEDIGLSYANLALAYSTQENFEKAIEYHQQAIQSFKERGQLANQVNSLYNLSEVYFKQGFLKKTKDTYSRAYLLSQKQEKPTMPGRFYLFESKVLVEKENYRKAIKNFHKATIEFEKSGDNHLLVSALDGITETYLLVYAEEGNDADLRKAIESGEKAVLLAKESDLLEQVNSVARLLITAYTEAENLEKIREFTELYVKSGDSLYNKQKAKTVLELQTQYETEKKEAEINFLSKENEVKATNLIQARELERKQNLIIALLVAGIGGVIFLLVWLYKIYLAKQRANKELESKNKIISIEKEKNEVLLKEIHHRVKNNLQVISSLLDLQTDNIQDEKALSAVEDGQNRVKAMALIHQKLYQNNNIGHIVFMEYAEDLVKQLSSIYSKAEKVIFEIRANNIRLDIDTAIPVGLILNELVSNAYKYGFSKQVEGELFIELKNTTKGEYCLNVKDNGPGLPDNFDLKKAKSLGLRLVKRLSKQLYGSVTYKNNNGADFYISFKNTESRKLVR